MRNICFLIGANSTSLFFGIIRHMFQSAPCTSTLASIQDSHAFLSIVISPEFKTAPAVPYSIALPMLLVFRMEKWDLKEAISDTSATIVV